MNKRINGNKVMFGYVNCAAFNRDPSGDYQGWSTTREERDEKLAKFREWAVSRGLSESASRSGPVGPPRRTVRVMLWTVRPAPHATSESTRATSSVRGCSHPAASTTHPAAATARRMGATVPESIGGWVIRRSVLIGAGLRRGAMGGRAKA